MSLNLGTIFEQQLIALAGWDPTTIDTGSTDIALLNTGGQTTVRATVTASVNTDALMTLITAAATPPAPTTPPDTTDPTAPTSDPTTSTTTS
jgi:hypothetical protein